MPAILLGKDAYRRAAARLPEVKLKNRFLEEDPTNKVDGVSILPRPGLVSSLDAAPAACRGAMWLPSDLGTDLLAVFGQQLYTVDRALTTATASGDITGVGRVEFATDGTNVFIAAGTLYLWDGTTLSTVATPDDVQIVSAVHFNGYILLQVADSGRFYWIEPAATTINALNFATAERNPDAGVCLRLLGDFIVLLQTDGAEFWVATGDADAPFQRQSGIVIEKGCSFRETAVNLDNGLFWVAETAEEGRSVYRSAQGAPERISVHGIEERMRDAESLEAFAFGFDGHAFYVLKIGGVGSFAYDAATRTWSEFASYGYDTWRPVCAAAASGAPLVLGDGVTGRLWTLDADAGDDGGDVIQRVVTGIIPTLERAVVDSISIQASVGWSPNHDLEPVMEMRLARDGFSFGDPKVRSLGQRGAFGTRVRWERQGEMKPPALVVEFSDADACQTRISYARWNEAG